MIIITVANSRTFLVLKETVLALSSQAPRPGAQQPLTYSLFLRILTSFILVANRHSVPFSPFNILFDGWANHKGLFIHHLIESPGPSCSLPLSLRNGWMVCILNIPFSLSVWWQFHLLHIYIPSLFFSSKKIVWVHMRVCVHVCKSSSLVLVTSQCMIIFRMLPCVIVHWYIFIEMSVQNLFLISYCIILIFIMEW